LRLKWWVKSRRARDDQAFKPHPWSAGQVGPWVLCLASCFSVPSPLTDKVLVRFQVADQTGTLAIAFFAVRAHLIKAPKMQVQPILMGTKFP
jgi:hypothetical protein